MSDGSTRAPGGRAARTGAAWTAISWIAAIVGILAVAMTLAQGLIGLAGVPRGAFWAVLIALTSPGLPIATLGLLCGAIGWFSAYRKRSLLGIAGFAITVAAFVILDVTIGGH